MILTSFCFAVHVPPVPPAQSFAKMAAKEIPPEKRPLSERAQYIINNQPVEDPMALNDDNFPTLGQSNLMAEEHASMDDKSMYSEISRFNQVNDDETKEAKGKLYYSRIRERERERESVFNVILL